VRFVLAVAGACLLLLAGVAVVVAAMSMGGPEILPLALIMPSALGGVRAALLRRAATQSRRT